MSIFSFSAKNKFFTIAEQEQIVTAIRLSEKQTSGEIRVYVESKNYLVSPMERAQEIFFKLEMEKTEHRNAVLFYIATKHQEVSIYGDEGIYHLLGKAYWENIVKNMIAKIQKENLATSIESAIHLIGNTLQEKFPYNEDADRNELPDNIVFGK